MIEKTVLPSGLTVMTERMPEIRSASIGFWVGAGSRDEPAEVQGASHFLEHLLFKGTSNRTTRQIAEAFDSVGGEANAFSEKEYTCYYGRVLDKDLPMAAEVLCDMLQDSVLAESDIEAERNVILEELAMHEDTPEDLVHDAFAETLFGDHPLGREIMGTVDSVKAIDRPALHRFYETNYTTADVTVSAAGNVSHEQVLDLVGAAFPTGESGQTARARHRGESASRLRVLDRSTEQAHIVVGGLGYHARHRDRFAWGVLDNLLGGGTSSRLFQSIREDRGLAYSVFSYRTMFSEVGSYAIYAGTGPANARRVLDLITAELDSVLEGKVTEQELAVSKGQLTGSLVLALEDSASRMARLGKSAMAGGELLSIDEILDAVQGVTIEEVQRVAAELLNPLRRTLTVIGPFKEKDFSSWVNA
ncbi:MAG: pitrilysin family protein [Actinomycetota bacterium]